MVLTRSIPRKSLSCGFRCGFPVHTTLPTEAASPFGRSPAAFPKTGRDEVLRKVHPGLKSTSKIEVGEGAGPWKFMLYVPRSDQDKSG